MSQTKKITQDEYREMRNRVELSDQHIRAHLDELPIKKPEDDYINPLEAAKLKVAEWHDTARVIKDNAEGFISFVQSSDAWHYGNMVFKDELLEAKNIPPQWVSAKRAPVGDFIPYWEEILRIRKNA